MTPLLVFISAKISLDVSVMLQLRSIYKNFLKLFP
jgi:hypothetical protein